MLTFPLLSRTSIAVVTALCLFTSGCSTEPKPQPAAAKQDRFTVRNLDTSIGGVPAVQLAGPEPADKSKPAILSADILPGRGMNIFQVKAYLPGKGVIDVLASPPLAEAGQLMNGTGDDEFGNGSFRAGGAILVPFANRIRGKLSADKKAIQAQIDGTAISLPANFKGKKPGAEIHSIHGLILNRAFGNLQMHSGDDASSLEGTLDAEDFNDHWVGKSAVDIKTELKDGSFGFQVTVKNVGDKPVPVGVGWHPYFALPSGQREQAKLYVPATKLVQVDNYDNVFPTGKLTPMKGKYAFNQRGGLALEKNFYDDCFVGVERSANGELAAEIVDPAAKYGIRIIGESPEITAFQAYAPPDKAFIAFEPQFNWGDPFGKVWKGQKTGMVTLQPGQSVTYKVRLEVFVPGA